MRNTHKSLLSRVGRRIQELRQASEITQEQLAERYGASAGYVQIVERGEQNLTLLTLEKFAQLLNVPVEELFREPKSRVRKVGRPIGS